LVETYIPLLAAIGPGREGRAFAFPDGGRDPVELDGESASLLEWISQESNSSSKGLDAGIGLDPGAIDILSKLEDRGLILRRSRFLERLRETAPRAATGAVPPRIHTVAVVTRDRPSLLARCAESYLDLFEARWSAEREERSFRLSVFDDGAEGLGALEPGCRRAAGAGCAISYCGPSEKAAYLAALSAELGLADDQGAALRFGLLGDPRWEYRGGANRNWALLDSLDEDFLLTDDDETARFRGHPAPLPGLEFSSAFDASELYFDQGWLAGTPSTSIDGKDLISGHEEVLGGYPGLLASAGSAKGLVEFGSASPRFLADLLLRPTAVAATVAGVCGDSGMGSPRGLLSLEGESRDRLLESRGSYEAAVTGRRVLWVAARHIISGSPFLRAGSIGLDGTRFLPPFLPCGRNDDGIFGILAHRCLGPGAIALTPAAVEHEPDQARGFDPDSASRTDIRLSDIVGWIAQDAPAARFPLDPDTAAARIGSWLSLAGALAETDFRDYLRVLWLRQASANIGHLASLLERHGNRPSFWAEDVEAVIEGLEETSRSGSPWIPSDCRAPAEEAGKACREAVALYGRFLESWPVIRPAARKLRSAGIRPSRGITR